MATILVICVDSVDNDPFLESSRNVESDSRLDMNTAGPICSMGVIEQLVQTLTHSVCSELSLMALHMLQM